MVSIKYEDIGYHLGLILSCWSKFYSLLIEESHQILEISVYTVKSFRCKKQFWIFQLPILCKLKGRQRFQLAKTDYFDHTEFLVFLYNTQFQLLFVFYLIPIGHSLTKLWPFKSEAV